MMNLPETPEPLPTLLETRFGSYEYDPANTVVFPEGVPGFESCRRFVLIASDDLAPLRCIHGLDAPHPSFLVIDPASVMPRYRTVLSPADKTRLGLKEDDTLLWLAIVAIEPDGNGFANLRAPIVINPRRMVGYQVMPHSSLYPIRHPLNV